MGAVEATAGAVKVSADNRFVCSGVGYLDQGVCPPFAHRDLWARALAAWRPGVSAVAWVKAHLSWEEAAARGIRGMRGRETARRTFWREAARRPTRWTLMWPPGSGGRSMRWSCP